MVGFFIKKSFFDGWDNLIGMVIHNLGYLLVLLALFGSMGLSQNHMVLSVVCLILSVGLFAFYTSGVSSSAWAYSKYERSGFEGFKKGLRQSWRHALLFWVLTLLDVSLIILVIPFYMSFGNTVGTILSVILFWVFVGLFLALMYYFPLSNVMSGDRPLKTLKKSFLLVFDNLWFSLFLALDVIISLVLSIFLAGLAPGGCGILLECQDATKLLMLKYDYQEANPEMERKNIPWDDILYDERECVGHRSLKNMIFPWKD
ncbi:hypothetical protein [uncultured Sphaerochaeta sp.]|uniref:hypothetical protein n=1 Tax=uncultured Sphaerochaeta sp. TaxID=886478 RepID=UPI002A0A3B4A|nr:hypothetical protein [uncultured Sphaerochaeta sp.]